MTAGSSAARLDRPSWPRERARRNFEIRVCMAFSTKLFTATILPADRSRANRGAPEPPPGKPLGGSRGA